MLDAITVKPVVPAVAFAGQDLAVQVGVVNMQRDKDKLFKVKVSLQIYDNLGTAILPKPATLDVQDMHDPVLNNLTRVDVIRVNFPLFLNRPGRYTFQIDAVDELMNQSSRLRLPLNVLDAKDHGAG